MTAIRFGTDGWRAIVADEFTMENVRVVAQAIAAYTKGIGQEEQGIIIGHDTRFLGRRFALAVAGVLAANGIRTYLANESVPTPVVAFGVKHFAVSGAIMITASHNPPEYNGIKYIPDYAGPATPEITERLEEEIQRIQNGGEVLSITPEEAVARRLLEVIVLRPHYEAHLRRMIHFDKMRQAHLRVVVDPMHGAGIGYVSRMLAEAGVETCGIRETADPFFGGQLPEPKDQHLSLLKQEVIKQKAALGLANDGDADRFGVVDRFGQYLTPNAILVLVAYHLVKNRGLRGRIVRTVATTHLLDRLAERYDLELVETPVGFKYIGAQMMRGDVLLGGEESGGASILGHIPEKDGVLINLLLAEMCAWEKKGIDQTLRDVYDEIGELFSTRMDIRLPEKTPWLEQIRTVSPAKVGPYAVTGVNRMDGIKLLLQGGHWVLIRPSGTEPLLRIYCEAASVGALNKITEAIRDWFS
ncbi:MULTISPECIES: phosphoglucomutase/phosphomannomutase family protein [Brevibacillus]|uniref:phosphoglucomutase/phosphomannomutase family protein n=1 Tax=Brevibacillus TaxID=55080 RepID=UPI0004F3C212|nr:phosphoglucomutase/phosphomannomutase family protein [Brevibacillus borstelensis]KKX54189.1 phosphoglucomutase [Brevibacillus borstelensis cifa_chp40]MCM3625606.1 phosphoglucomutase/phosphomannomutase family protein [Brevibacillus borstelensis]MED1882858.1 phosphoglucomutase/phosphomannomutase family protein [Brevibacillus borstelensis]MED2011211.1 phosphoglucomutase/phosphomannomutase family protein [Brevibacillus borstelensis]RNB60072.1 phosphoglucomutase/phosphomannomutase family protein